MKHSFESSHIDRPNVVVYLRHKEDWQNIASELENPNG